MATIFKRRGSRFYYVSWWEGEFRRTESTGYELKEHAEVVKAEKKRRELGIKLGVIDLKAEAAAVVGSQTIESHLLAFETKMRADHRSAGHIEFTCNVVRKFAAAAGIATVAEIERCAVDRYVTKLKDEGWSVRTINSHKTAIKAVTKWLAELGVLISDPLIGVKKGSVKTDRRRKRRVLSRDEWHWLESTFIAGPVRYGMTGDERRLLCRTALQTGLRSSELRKLTRGSIIANADKPHILCDAGTTKNKKQARLYIDKELATELQRLAKLKMPDAPLFAMPHKTDVAEMIREDLAVARADWLKEAKDDPDEFSRRDKSDFLTVTNHEGESLDFHALRHTCGAWLALAGVQPKVIQTIMRHSTITLTMDTYGHLFPGQEADAAARLHAMLNPDRSEVRATGTDSADAILSFEAQRNLQQSGREQVRGTAAQRGRWGSVSYSKSEANAERNAVGCDVAQIDATQIKSSGDGTRTRDSRIMNPVL